MHAVVFNVTIADDSEESRNFLHEQIVPRVKEAPGFVSGNWVSLPNGKGTAMIVFESEDAARGALEQGPDPGPGVTIDSAEIGEVAASA